MVVYGALDIGGTKIAGALVDPRGRLLARAERPTPAREPAEVLMGAVTAVLDELSGHSAWQDLARLGVASAGPVDRAAGTVSPVNIPGWRGFPLIQRVRSHPRVPAHADPVLVGDAVAMTAAEHWLGAARGVDSALCMVVSTGIGGGLVLGGRLHAGRTGNAGHIGHISVDLDGSACPCGARGCVEGLASGTAIAARALAAGWTPPPGVAATAAGVAVAARSGDPVARAVYDRAAQALAASIAATAALVELDLVVIGGGVAQAGDTLFAPLRRHLADYAVLDFARDLPVVPAALALNAGLIGAAAVAAGAAGAAAESAAGAAARSVTETVAGPGAGTTEGPAAGATQTQSVTASAPSAASPRGTAALPADAAPPAVPQAYAGGSQAAPRASTHTTPAAAQAPVGATPAAPRASADAAPAAPQSPADHIVPGRGTPAPFLHDPTPR